MSSRLAILASVAALAVAGGCHRTGGEPAARAVPSPFEALAIDSSAAAYTEVVGIPSGEAGRAPRRDAERRGAVLVPWSAVEAEPLRYLGGAIERDRFGLRRRLGDVLDLLARRPGRPLAIAWDGGLAESDADRALATSRRIAARQWPTDLPAPERDPGDPLDPARLLDR